MPINLSPTTPPSPPSHEVEHPLTEAPSEELLEEQGEDKRYNNYINDNYRVRNGGDFIPFSDDDPNSLQVSDKRPKLMR